MNKETQITLRLLVCGYLVYLAYSICRTQLSGSSGVPDVFAYGAAAVMALSGIGFSVYHLRQYFRDRKSAAQDTLIEDDDTLK